MSKELTVQEWTEELNSGLKFRQQWGLESEWGKLEAILAHVHPSVRNAGPNILISTIDALSSALNVPNPYITVKARNSMSIDKARVLESVDNLLVDLMSLQSECDRATISAFLWGVGILKIGYDSEFGWDQSLDIGLENPMGMTLSQFDKNQYRIEFNRFQPGMPWVKMVLPHDFVVPWGVYSLDESPWVMHRVVRHIDAVRSDTKYDKRATNQLTPNMSMEDFTNSYKTMTKPYRFGYTDRLGSSTEGEEEYVELWEIRDRCTGRIMVMASGTNRWLRNDVDLLQHNGFPFATIAFTPRVRSFWTSPDAHYLQYHQAELSDIALQTTKQRRINVLKLLLSKGAFDPKEADRLISGDVGAVMEVNGDIDKAARPMTMGQPNLGLYQDAAIVRTNAREQVGFSKNQVGEFEQTGRRTATEVAEVAQAAGLRLDRRQNQLKILYTEVFSKVNPIIFENWKMQRLVEVIGPDGMPAWRSVNGDALKGEYNYKIGFSTGGAETLQERRGMAMQLFPMLLQMGAPPEQVVRWLTLAINDPEFSAMFQNNQQNGGTNAQGIRTGSQPEVRMGGGQAGPARPAA